VVVSVQQVIIELIMVVVFYQNSVAGKMKPMKHVVQLLLKLAIKKQPHVRLDALLVAFVLARIMFVKLTALVVLAFRVEIVRNHVKKMINRTIFAPEDYLNKKLHIVSRD
jgi:hypothetical protein